MKVIINNSLGKFETEVVMTFKVDEYNKEYIVYRFDDEIEEQISTIHTSSLLKTTDERFTLEEIADDNEWSVMKKIMEDVVTTGKNKVKVQDKEYNYKLTPFNALEIFTNQSGGKEYLGRVSMTKNAVVKGMLDKYDKINVIQKFEPKNITPVEIKPSINVIPEEVKEEVKEEKKEPINEEPKPEILVLPEIDYSSLSITALENLDNEYTEKEKKLKDEVNELKLQMLAHPHEQNLIEKYSIVGKNHDTIVTELEKIDKELDRKYDEGIHSPISKEHEEEVAPLKENNNMNDIVYTPPVLEVVEKQPEQVETPVYNEQPVIDNPSFEQPSTVKNKEENSMKFEVDFKEFEIPNFTSTQMFKDSLQDFNRDVAKLLTGADKHYMDQFKSTINNMGEQLTKATDINEELRTTIVSKEQNIASLNEEKARLEATIESKNREIDKSKDEIQVLKVEIDKMIDQDKNLHLQLDDGKARIQSLEGTVEGLKGDLVNMEQLKNVAETKLDQTEREGSVLKRQADTATTRVRKLEASLKAALDEISSLKSEKSVWEVNQKRFDKVCSDFQAQINERDENIRDLQGRIATMEKISSNNEKDSEERISQLTHTLDIVTKDKNTLEARLLDKNRENERLQKENESFTNFMRLAKEGPMGPFFSQMMGSDEEVSKGKTKVA